MERFTNRGVRKKGYEIELIELLNSKVLLLIEEYRWLDCILVVRKCDVYVRLVVLIAD
jgi:hypothetical protein